MAKEDDPTDSSSGSVTNWSLPRVISARLEVPEWATSNVVKLISEGCTIPFIARYRREATGSMDIQKLRDVSSLVEELVVLQNKISSVKSSIRKMGKMTKDLEAALKNAQYMTEVDDLYVQFKPGNKGTLAERARALGLEPLAKKFLNGSASINLENFIKQGEKGLSSKKEVKEGVIHIIADIVHKDPDTMEKLRELCTDRRIMLEASLSQSKKKKQLKPGEKNPERERHKFEFYDGKKFTVYTLKPHVVLALNRGEDLKILNIKVELGEQVKRALVHFCERKWLRHSMDRYTREVVSDSIEDAYNRMMMPQMTRIIRTQLTKDAEKASIEVFASNLKRLLLAPPLRGKTILALDPGFTNGCKAAVISPTGQVLDTDVIFMHNRRGDVHRERSKLLKLIVGYRCDLFGIGNGVACRETETFVSDIIQKDYPNMKYCIVDESGASIYSASDLAIKELSDMELPLRGAVSIGRRLLDPLAELVKIDPKHLGVGQYQHDMPAAQLKSSLNSTIEECVSFVGADINTSSECLLSHIAGMSSVRAKNIIQWREKNGRFVCREQLMCVKGLGVKSYEQAAGFVRVHHDRHSFKTSPEEPEYSEVAEKGKRKRKTTAAPKKVPAKKRKMEDFRPNLLDMTCVHPESYPLAQRLMEKIDLQIENIGTPQFISKVDQFVKKNSLSDLATQLDCGEPTLKLITDAFLKPLAYDIREEFQKPLFRSVVSSIMDLKSGESLTGKVMNVTHFGAFVDIGVGETGLVHTSQMPRHLLQGKTMLELGDKVQVFVQNVDIAKGRIGLRLEKILD